MTFQKNQSHISCDQHAPRLAPSINNSPSYNEKEATELHALIYMLGEMNKTQFHCGDRLDFFL